MTELKGSSDNLAYNDQTRYWLSLGIVTLSCPSLFQMYIYLFTDDVTGRAQLIGEDYNLGDQLLYEAFNQSWWSREDTSSTDLWNEVRIV